MKQPTRNEKELIRKIQQSFAYAKVDLRGRRVTGEVYSVFDDWTCTGDEYLGTIRRRYIPHRKSIQKSLREMPESEIKKREEWDNISKRYIFIFWEGKI